MANSIRLEYIDVELAQRVSKQLRSMTEDSRRMLSTAPAKHAKRQFSMFSSELKMLANYEYALGEPLAQVAVHMREAAEAKLRVFELRESFDGMPIETVSIAIDERTGARVDVTRDTAFERDQSLTNSRDGLDAIYLSMATGHPLLAHRIAQLIADPPAAPYIGIASDICTPDDQHIAYSVKACLAGDHENASGELRLVSRKDARTVAEADLVEACLRRDRDRFMQALTAHLAWHRREAVKKKNRKDTNYFLDLQALGVAALAIHEGLIAVTELPDDVPHFPAELLMRTP